MSKQIILLKLEVTDLHFLLLLLTRDDGMRILWGEEAFEGLSGVDGGHELAENLGVTWSRWLSNMKCCTWY